MTDVVAGVDVGGTKVAAIVVDGSGETAARAVRRMTRDGNGAPIEPIVAAVHDALGAIPDARIGAIGVGVPGRVDGRTGAVRLANNLGWHGVPLADRLEAEFGIPCRVENDARVAAAGLVGTPAALGARSLAYVSVGTGIGAGLVLDGRLHRGARAMAGEIGHVIVAAGGPACPCGQRGCLEAVAAGPAIARRATEAILAGRVTSLASVQPLTARDVCDAARRGDGLAREIVEDVAGVIARAVAGLVTTCDVERVLIGGGVAAAGAVIAEPLHAELGRMRAASDLIAELLPAGSVELLPPGSDAVAWGGVALARRALDEMAARGGRPRTGTEEVVARASGS